MTDKEREILQFEEDHKAELDAIYDKIHVEVEQNIVQQAQVRKRRKQTGLRFASIAAAFILVVCLSVVLPIVLMNDNSEEVIRFNSTDIIYESVEYTLKSYYHDLGESVLYLDWYDTVEDRTTTRYYDINDFNTTVYMEEYFVNEDGYSVLLSVMRSNIVVESFEENLESTKEISGIVVSYLTQPMFQFAQAKFEYQGYKYYLEFADSADEEFILSTIESMFH